MDDKFNNVIDMIKTEWPTLEQVSLLCLKTTDESQLREYIRWLINKSEGSQLRNRLSFLVISESILNSPTLQVKFLPVLKAIRDKLFILYDKGELGEMYQYTLKIMKCLAKFRYLTKVQIIFNKKLTRKEIRRFAWYFPRQYLALRAFVEIIGEAVYDPRYRYCQARELKFLESQ